jgi:hypothetical protein
VDDARIGVLNEQERIPVLLLVTSLMRADLDRSIGRAAGSTMITTAGN